MELLLERHRKGGRKLEENSIDMNVLIQRLATKLANFEIQTEVLQLETERLRAEIELLKEKKKETK